jgi:ASC-1-like (ASCH) protein/GNAT superfamily N-acetyltransferase
MSVAAHLADGPEIWGLLSEGNSTEPMSNGDLEVRFATNGDRDYLRTAFQDALDPFYGGDHHAHVDRLLRTHLSGGVDRRGLLSTRQVLYVLWCGQTRVGALNLVFKRQGTCKISPLILYPAVHRNHGLGAHLLETAERAARNLGARQLYCTVAKRNHDALSFFLQAGFVACGQSDDQYKDGVTEVLLRRPLLAAQTEDGPESIISVGELRSQNEWAPARRLLLDGLSDEVSDADDRWLDSLWAGAEAGSACPGAATTWVFGARDRLDRYRAAAIGMGKKGDAIKVMPLASADIEGFRAMVIDLPSLLMGKGRKAYLHIAPDAEQVSALQLAGWRLEGLLPAAYCQKVVTQQWGCQLGEDVSVSNLRIHPRFLDLIKRGKKTLEIRVGYDHVKRIRPGDTLRLFSKSEPAPFEVTVADVRSYHSFTELLDHEEVTQALPGMSAEEALRELRRIYPRQKEERGVLVLELKIPAVH